LNEIFLEFISSFVAAVRQVHSLTSRASRSNKFREINFMKWNFPGNPAVKWNKCVSLEIAHVASCSHLTH